MKNALDINQFSQGFIKRKIDKINEKSPTDKGEALELIKLENIKIVELEEKSTQEQTKGVDETLKIQGISIHKNKKCSTWYTRFRRNGGIVYISAKTQKECYEKLKQALNIAKKEKQDKKEYSVLTWHNKWLELFKIGKVKNSTLKDYRSLLKHIDNNILKTKINLVKEIDIIDNLNKVKGERQKQKLYEFIKDMFNKAYQYGIIKKNIFDRIEKPKHIQVNGKAFTTGEQIKFINQCEQEELGYIFLIILYQGLRKGEALALTYNDFNLEKLTMTINKNLDKDNKIGTTKNIYSNRTIPIFNKTLEIIKKLVCKNGNDRICIRKAQNLHEIFKSILKRAEIDTSHKIHDLRHTFITNCKNLNVPEHIIQSIVGHRIGSRITSEVYTHLQEETVNYNADIINKFYTVSTQLEEKK